MIKSYNDRADVVEAIIAVSLRSAQAKEINIFELGNLNDLLTKPEAEKIRKQFVEYHTPIKQITNHRKLTSWTDNAELTQQNLKVKYVSPDNFQIINEILIFDTTVAVYRLQPSPLYLEIDDELYAQQMHSLFDNIWRLGDALLLSEDGSTLSKQYMPLNTVVQNIPVVIYPAKDDGNIEQAFSRTQPGAIEKYVRSLVEENQSIYGDSDMILAYIWNLGKKPCADIWKVSRNNLSDDSGLLYDARIYQDHEATTELGIASGNSSIVLTAEEFLLRELVMDKGLPFKEAADRTKYRARFPLGYVPDEEFYPSSHSKLLR